MKSIKPFKLDNNIPVCFATDEKFVPYLSVAISSLLLRADSSYSYDVIILHEADFSPNTVQKLQDTAKPYPNASLRLINVKEAFEKWKNRVKTTIAFPVSSYYRFLIPELFEQYKRVIYLDGDIMLAGDISRLYNQPLPAGTVLAMVQDIIPFAESPSVREEMYLHCQYLSLPSSLVYSNSGVILWDISQARHFKLTEKLTKGIEKFDQLKFPDQDILNAVCCGKIYQLHLRFNCFNRPPDQPQFSEEEIPVCLPAWENYALQRKEAENDPVIIHYAGELKPWFYPDVPYGKEWWKEAEKTPLYEEIIQRLRFHDQKMKDYKKIILREKLLYYIYKTSGIFSASYKIKAKGIKEMNRQYRRWEKCRIQKKNY